MAVSKNRRTNPQLLYNLEMRFRSLHRRRFLAVNRVKEWAAALKSDRYINEPFGLGQYIETPEDYANYEGKLVRDCFGILCEVSTLCRLVLKPGTKHGILIQDALLVDGLPVTGHLAHRPEYTYEKSAFFPAASVRAWLIASNRLEEYAESVKLQLELIDALMCMSKAAMYYELSDLGATLEKAVRPVML